MDKLITDYMNYLDNGKTERRCVDQAIALAEKAGYKDINKVKKIKAGDKVYVNKMGKAIMLFNFGTNDIEEGMNILCAHIDSPRLDVKQNPVYESEGIVYLNTHYYGGIKKYQWLAMPLALNGVVFLANGKKIDINIGDDPSDPVFCISDILPHIAQTQMAKPASELVEGEKLDVIIGTKCKADENDDEDKNPTKTKILAILKKKYGFEEADFQSAEIEVVPAGKARFAGFDNSLILAYGQDDRVCGYTSLAAMLEAKTVKRTACCLLVDKEEIGSAGATGMNSKLMDNAMAEVVDRLDKNYKNPEIVVRRALENSMMLSSDVNSAYDPLNAELYDKQNSSFLGNGIVLNKYTGSRGKSTASDANPEFIAKVRGVFNKNKVDYQTAELAKVDIGGGGTIAHFAAEYGMSVLDAGVAVLSMHAPWELTSVYDVQQTYKAYKAFLTLEK